MVVFAGGGGRRGQVSGGQMSGHYYRKSVVVVVSLVLRQRQTSINYTRIMRPLNSARPVAGYAVAPGGGLGSAAVSD